MKIALIRKKFNFHGGAERHASELIKALIKKNHEVHIFANKWEKLEAVFYHHIFVLPVGSFF